MFHFIGIHGYDSAGKDTTATLVQIALYSLASSGWGASAYALGDGPRHVISGMFGFAVARQCVPSGLSKDSTLLDIPRFGERNARWLMRAVGHGLREAVHPDVWIEVLERRLANMEPLEDRLMLVVPDIRYSNEMKWLLDEKKGRLIVLQPPDGTPELRAGDNHPSNRGLFREIEEHCISDPALGARVYWHTERPRIESGDASEVLSWTEKTRNLATQAVADMLREAQAVNPRCDSRIDAPSSPSPEAPTA